MTKENSEKVKKNDDIKNSEKQRIQGETEDTR